MPEVRSSGGVRIHYDDVGRGEPTLLFIPGWCTSREIFRPLLSRCATRHRVLSVDLRGHGQSERGTGDFDSNVLLEDLRTVIDASGARQVVPVALSHAGWLALNLRRELGVERVPRMVLLDWIVSEPPPPFLEAVRGLMSDQWREARDGLFRMWSEGVDNEDVVRFIREDMGSFPEEMWARAAREISAAYTREGSPLRALATLDAPTPTMHLYAQPESHDYLAAQVAYSADHPWFHVMKLPATSHFPTFEVPDIVAAGIEALVSARETYVNTAVQVPGTAPA